MLKEKFAVINGNNVNVTTVFDNTVQYTPTREEADNIQQEARSLLSEYFDFLDEGRGLRNMFNPNNGVFWKEKGWLIEAFKKHPFYNGKYQIVLRNQDMNRYLNMDAVHTFVRYCISWLGDFNEANYEYTNPDTGEVMTQEEGKELYEKINQIYMKAKDIYNNSPYGSYEELKASIQMRATERKLKSMRTNKKEREIDYFRLSLREITRFLENNATNIISEELANTLRCIASDYGKERIRIDAGQKISKVMQKIAKEIGIDKHTDIQDISFTRIVDRFGVPTEEIVHRTKDLGWNKQYADFSDAINPLKKKGTLVISVNPIDFWTMSFGDNWASCHTIDKENRRRITSHTYSGCYCGGTESYMLDKPSFIVYYLKDDFDGDHPELQAKIKRCMFYLGEDKLIQSRVYPDGRDGGDKSLAGDLREIVQRVIANLWDVPNYWKNEKGTSACEEVTTTCGPNYPDYECYEDCNVSYLKRIDGYLNKEVVAIGNEIICPECGQYHSTEDNIFCEECREERRCRSCGERISRDDAYYLDDDWYCSNCIELCEDCQEPTPNTTETERGRCVCDACLNNNYTWSNWLNEYIEDDDVVETAEGRICSDYDAGGYGFCERCNEAHNDDALIYDEESNQTLCEDCYNDLVAEREAEAEAESEE